MWIPVKVVAKQRARLTRPRRGRKMRAFTPQQTVHFENAIAEFYAANGGVNHGTIPVGVSVEIHIDGFNVEVYPLECSVRPVGVRGDVDNIVKAILDGLNGVAWHDDRQVEMFDVAFVGAPRKGTEWTDPSGVEEGGSDDDIQGSGLGGSS